MNRLARLLQAFARRMAALSPDCRQASRLQSEALDHRLPILKRAGLRIHLALCQWCRRYGQHIRCLRDVVRRHPERFGEPARSTLSDATRERIKQRLRTEEP